MAIRIILDQDFENWKKGQVILVTSTKHKKMVSDKIRFKNRISSVTGVRNIEFEQKEKPKKSK